MDVLPLFSNNKAQTSQALLFTVFNSISYFLLHIQYYNNPLWPFQGGFIIRIM